MGQGKFVEDSLKQTIILQIFKKPSSTNFAWSILEYVVPYVDVSLDMPNATWDIVTIDIIHDRDITIGIQLKDI